MSLMPTSPPTAVRPARRLAGDVLLIEDDPDQARLLATWLHADTDFAVTVVESALAAMACIHERPWSLLISDVDLPGVGGIEMTRWARTRVPHTPIMLVTATGTVDKAVSALKLGADDFVLKPLQRATLVTRIEACMEARRTAPAPQTVLAVGAHPDDVEIGCGGILLDHRARGDRVIVLTLSRGAHGGATEVRMAEAHAAAKHLGAELEILDLPDTQIPEAGQTIAVIAEAIARHRPTIIYTHSLHEQHQDHRAVYHATMVAARNVGNVYCYQSPSTTLDFVPRRFVDIDRYVNDKIEVLGRYQSQTSLRPYLEPGLVRATARYWGRFAGYGCVEPLEVVRSGS